MTWIDHSFFGFACFCAFVCLVSSLSLRRPYPIRDMLEKSIMPGSLAEHGELWEQASPMARVYAEAPPFFVVHGGADVLTAAEGAEDFVRDLAGVSKQPVAFAVLPATQHGFDGMGSLRTNYLLNHITDFLEWAYAHR